MGMNDGPPAPGCKGFFYRLTYAGVASTNNMIAFDLTAPGPTAHVVGDFDFRCGGQFGTHADGIGVALLPTSAYGTTGMGPNISEEGSQGSRDGALGFGLDTYNNGGLDLGNPGLPNGSDSSEVSVNMTSASTFFNTAVDLYALPLGAGGANQAYDLHNDNADDCTVFDHCHFTVDIDSSGGGATVSVSITSNQPPASSTAADANPFTTLAPGTTFKAITVIVPGVVPYEMRLAFGGRTGGAYDNNDIANVNVTFSP